MENEKWAGMLLRGTQLIMRQGTHESKKRSDVFPTYPEESVELEPQHHLHVVAEPVRSVDPGQNEGLQPTDGQQNDPTCSEVVE